MLLSAAMLLPTLPFAAATTVSARADDTVVYEDIMSKSSVSPFGAGDKYIRVANITNKNDGVVFKINTEDVADGDVIKVSVRIRPAIGVRNYVTSVNNKKADGTAVKNEAAGASGQNERGFRIYANNMPLIGEIVLDDYSNKWNSSGYKPETTGTYTNVSWNYNNLPAYTKADADSEYAAETISEGDPYSLDELFASSALTARDSEGWLTYTAVFKMSETNSTITAVAGENGAYTLGRYAGIAPKSNGVLEIKIGGTSFTNGKEDVAPFDIDDLKVYKAAEGTVISAAARDIVSGDTEIVDESFDDESSVDIATPLSSVVYHVHDEDDYYRFGDSSRDANLGKITLGAGKYKIVGEFRLSGYNASMVGYNDVTPEIANSWNWREVRVMYSSNAKDFKDATLVNTGLKSNQGGGNNAMVKDSYSDEWVTLEWTLPELKVGETLDITHFRLRGGTSGDTVAYANTLRTGSGLEPLPTVDENNNPYGSTAANGVDLPDSYKTMGMDHRNIFYDVKNLRIVRTTAYTVDESEVSDTPNEWDITGNVLPDAVATVNGTEAAPTVEAGYKNNKYLQFYDRTGSGIMSYTVDANVAAGTDIYVSFEGRTINSGSAIEARLTSSVAGAPLFKTSYTPEEIVYSKFVNSSHTSVVTDGVSVFELVLQKTDKETGEITTPGSIKSTVNFFTPTNTTELGLTPYYDGELSPMNHSAKNCAGNQSYHFYDFTNEWQYSEFVLKSVAAHTNMTITLQRGMNGAYNTPLEIDNFKVFYFPGNDMSNEPVYLEYQTFDDAESVNDFSSSSGGAGMFRANNGKFRLVEDSYTVDVPAKANTAASVTYTWDRLPAGVYTLGGNVRLDHYNITIKNNVTTITDSANLSVAFKNSDGTDSAPLADTALNCSWIAIPEGVTMRQESTGPATLTISLDKASSFKLSELSLIKTATTKELYTVTVECGDNGFVDGDEFEADENDGVLELLADFVPEPVANYAFDGWYIGDAKVTEETKLTANITVTAKFVPASYTFTEDDAADIMTVTGVSDGKATYLTDIVLTVTTDETPTVIVTIGNGEPETLVNPTPEGNVYTYTVAGADVKADVTVKASIIASYKVTFTPKPSEAGGSFEAMEFTVFEGEKLTANNIAMANTAVNAANPGYEFAGWTDNESGTENGGFDFANIVYSNHATYYAIFKKADYTVSAPSLGETAMFGITVNGEAYDGTVNIGDTVKLVPDSDAMLTTVSYKIGDGEATPLTYDNGYVLPAEAIIGNVEIIVTELAHKEVDSTKYLTLADNTQLVVITAAKDKAYTVTVGETTKEVYWSDMYGGYVFVAPDSWTPAEIGRGLTAIEGDVVAVQHGNVTKGDSKVTAADASVVSQMLHNKNLEGVTDYMRIAADASDTFELNGAYVDVADCTAILYKAAGVDVTPTLAD